MKHLLSFSLSLLFSHLVFSQNKINGSCSDMGVENGWSQWTGIYGSAIGANPPNWTGSPTNPPPAPTSSQNISITSGTAVDPCTPGASLGSPAIPVVCPGSGNASIQLGVQQTSGGVAERITFPLTVTANDTNFIYSYALVFYDPGSSHAYKEKPYAEFMILDANGDTVPCSYNYFVHQSGDLSFYQTNNSCQGGTSTFYKPWTSSGVSLTPYVGQTLTVVVTNGDCAHGGHFGHSYWDFSCGPNVSKFCSGTAVTLCAPVDTFSTTSYQWYNNGIASVADTFNCISTTPQNLDTLSLHVLSAPGCSFFIQYVMVDSCLTSIQQSNLSGSEISIYPNPASSYLQIDFIKTSSGVADVAIYNILGEEMMYARIYANSKNTIDVSKFSDGIYFLKLKTKTEEVTKKIVVSH